MDEETKDQMALILVGIFFVAGGGLSMFAGTVFPKAQALLEKTGILVPADQSIFEIADTGTGPSTLFLLILLGLICLLVVVGPKMSKPKGGERP